MTVEELKALVDAGTPPVVLDVREPFELSMARFPFDVVNIPMGALQARLSELPSDVPIVCACRSGSRSAQVARFLSQRGYEAVNLEGGILAYAARVDPTVPRY